MYKTITKRVTVSLGAALVAATALSACTSATGGDAADTSGVAGKPTAGGSAVGSSAPATAQAAAAAVITASTSAEKPISPADPVGVSIANGTLSSVSLLNPAGKAVDGTLSADHKSWHASEKLGYGKTYKLTAAGTNADGVAVRKQTTIATVEPDNLTMPSITDVAGNDIGTGDTYGVGMLVRVHFDESVNRKSAQKSLAVTTSPQVAGSWYWSDSQNAWWRPQSYYATGTKVSVKADVYGKKLGKGLYGQDDKAASFTIGQKRVSIADPKKHTVKVYFDGKLERTMPTSMGKGGHDPITPSINYWTMYGNYTVLDHENPAIMSAGSFGVSKNSPNYFAPEKVPYSTKISTDGIYLHELDATDWAQGHQNLSHGCLNLNYKNAKWYYNHSRVGDVVQVNKGLGNPKITFDQGGQWSVSWSDWLKGSALS